MSRTFVASTGRHSRSSVFLVRLNFLFVTIGVKFKRTPRLLFISRHSFIPFIPLAQSDVCEGSFEGSAVEGALATSLITDATRHAKLTSHESIGCSLGLVRLRRLPGLLVISSEWPTNRPLNTRFWDCECHSNISPTMLGNPSMQ
jgi:hypothetical protein